MDLIPFLENLSTTDDVLSFLRTANMNSYRALCNSQSNCVPGTDANSNSWRVEVKSLFLYIVTEEGGRYFFRLQTCEPNIADYFACCSVDKPEVNNKTRQRGLHVNVSMQLWKLWTLGIHIFKSISLFLGDSTLTCGIKTGVVCDYDSFSIGTVREDIIQ